MHKYLVYHHKDGVSENIKSNQNRTQHKLTTKGSKISGMWLTQFAMLVVIVCEEHAHAFTKEVICDRPFNPAGDSSGVRAIGHYAYSNSAADCNAATNTHCYTDSYTCSHRHSNPRANARRHTFAQANSYTVGASGQVWRNTNHAYIG
jgi:hypothetical protein